MIRSANTRDFAIQRTKDHGDRISPGNFTIALRNGVSRLGQPRVQPKHELKAKFRFLFLIVLVILGLRSNQAELP
jgi:hypothetical protein